MRISDWSSDVCSSDLFLVSHDIQQQSYRTHVQRDQHEPPLHHRRLRVASELVPCDVGSGQHGQYKPDVHENIERLNQHAVVLLIAVDAARLVAMSVPITVFFIATAYLIACRERKSVV